MQLGVQHILLGVDHLLFVLGLMLIVSDRWALVKTITSFTLAHSITLAIATLGYASALTSMGLPKAEIPLALLLFNVGVELGQIAFVLLVILLERSFRVLEVHWPRLVERLPGYAVGTLGAYWTIQRTLILLTGAR